MAHNPACSVDVYAIIVLNRYLASVTSVGLIMVCAVGASITCSATCQSNSLARTLTMCASDFGRTLLSTLYHTLPNYKAFLLYVSQVLLPLEHVDLIVHDFERTLLSMLYRILPNYKEFLLYILPTLKS
ncbi:hypothetical protein CFC21_052528 [Triticum aestivum]|uniref:Uncharacterized protein n=3 Tax=Triticum TaxID=4564 RepID=A0A9R0SBH4_TRITD|nr:hypothetical protein CFC21_052528 [Triticum aestivum]VAH92262.1 unnamed protein product [Triticum turgidum subsp. durum]